MKKIFLGLFTLFISLPVQAEFLAESDTGMFSPGLDCALTRVETTNVTFFEDNFGYLNVHASFNYVCRLRNGHLIEGRGSDSMFFPTLSFDSQSQDWKINGVSVAHRTSSWKVDLADGIVDTVWLDMQEHSLSFKVQLERADDSE